MRVVVGVFIGLLAGAGGLLGYQQLEARRDPCLGRCGEGTSCQEGICRREEAPPPVKKPRRRQRRTARRHTGSEQETLKKPTAGQLARVAQGPALGSTDYLNLTEAERGTTRELSEEEVTRRFRQLEPRIVACIDAAREGWAIDRGRVEVGFRIERSGRVERVRVAGPAVMQQGGLGRCISALVQSLRFPPSARVLVMTFPYQLD